MDKEIAELMKTSSICDLGKFLLECSLEYLPSDAKNRILLELKKEEAVMASLDDQGRELDKKYKSLANQAAEKAQNKDS